MNIISGEQIQELCDVYLGHPEDFRFNPRISRQSSRCLEIRSIVKKWTNPGFIFVYAHRLSEFSGIIDRLENKFILVTHNSDENITEKYAQILECPKLIMWHAQNIMIHHEKLQLLPIGIANSMWPHGNIGALRNIMKTLKNETKPRDFYFYFNIRTNLVERIDCKEQIEKTGLVFEAPQRDFETYLKHLSTFKYAICPPGNGIDSHRIWECLYLGVIPILKQSVFAEKLKEKFPCVIILNTWTEFNPQTLIKTYQHPDPMLYDTNEQIHNHSAMSQLA